MERDAASGLQPFVSTSKGPPEKSTASWSTHDRACSHCRERKIRCGRERPQCANCERDGVECGYYAPGKRVNHIKLLCNNVGSLEDRLGNIEVELSRLMAFLKTGGMPKPLENVEAEEDSATAFLDGKSESEYMKGLLPTGRHIVRNQEGLIDRYHGPCTLFALCREFSETAIAKLGIASPPPSQECSSKAKDGGGKSKDDVRDLLTRMCYEAGIEEPFDFQTDYVPIRLPPKQFLLMVQVPFFEQADFATDIFVQSNFWFNVERLYGRQFTAVDEPWAICFHAIILLVLGSEISTQGNGPLVGSQFAHPFLLAVRTALGNPRFLMAPTLINIQALALLSIAAQQYFPPGFAASIFAQACVLARTMGLHQTHVIQDGVSSEEAQERFKIFRSLYLRDKWFSISRGSICWLPSFDSSLPSEPSQGMAGSHSYNSRIRLASSQEDIYKLFYSADSSRLSAVKYKTEISRIEQSLEDWAKRCEIFSSSCTCSRDVVDLQLEFLGTRICAFRGSSEPAHIQRVINDARASCMLLLISYGKHDNSMIEQLESLPLFKCPSKSLGRAATRSSKRKGLNKAMPSGGGKGSLAAAAPLRFHSLLDSFSVPAFFILVNNALWPPPTRNESQAEQDLALLQQVCDCYNELDTRNSENNYTRKVGHAFRRLLAVVNLMKNSQQPLPSPHMAQQSSDSHIPTTEQHIFNQRTPNFPDFPDLPGSPVYLTSSVQQDPMLLSKDMPSRSTEITPANESPVLPTPLDTDYLNQWYDPLRQTPFSPSFQHPVISVPGRKRPRFSDTEANMGDPNAASLSDFLTTTNMMTF